MMNFFTLSEQAILVTLTLGGCFSHHFLLGRDIGRICFTSDLQVCTIGLGGKREKVEIVHRRSLEIQVAGCA